MASTHHRRCSRLASTIDMAKDTARFSCLKGGLAGLTLCHSRTSGNPEPRHVRPSLDARFRGHDTEGAKGEQQIACIMAAWRQLCLSVAAEMFGPRQYKNNI